MAGLMMHFPLLVLLIGARSENSADAPTCSRSECANPDVTPVSSPVITRSFSMLQTGKSATHTNNEDEGCDWCEKSLGWIGKTMMQGGADSDPHARSDPDIQHAINSADEEEIGEAMIHRTTHDISSHKVHLCVMDIQKDEGVSSNFPLKCKMGVSCDNCEYYKAEIGVGYDFCQGANFEAQVGGALIVKVPLSGPSTLKDIWNDVAEEKNDEHANAFQNAVLETLATVSNSPQYSTDALFQFSGKSEVSAGVGGKFDARVGYNACDPSTRCWGVEVAAKLKFNVAIKAFVCIKGNQLTVSAGLANFAFDLDLKYISGGFVSRPTGTSKYKSADDPPSCMLKPHGMTVRSSRDDSLCPLLRNQVACNGHPDCYWDNKRQYYCFAVKCWKDKHPGHGDGLCPWLGTAHACHQHDNCVWAARPCLRQPCKDFIMLMNDYRRNGRTWSDANRCELAHYPTDKTMWEFSGEHQ